MKFILGVFVCVWGGVTKITNLKKKIFFFFGGGEESSISLGAVLSRSALFAHTCLSQT